MFRTCAVISNGLMWICCGVFTTPAFAQAVNDGTLGEKGFYISLPVYVTSIIGTAGFTWAVAKYDNARVRKIDQLEATYAMRMAQLNERIDHLSHNADDLSAKPPVQ